MKTLTILLVLFCTAAHSSAQEALPRAEALRQLYQHYDDATKTAQWVCAKVRATDDPCWKGEDATVSIALLLAAEVNEGGVEKTYVVANAEPSNKDRWQCHVCGPAIGVAVFALQSNQWILQSKNEATGFFGSFGEPGNIDLVAVGPHRYGIMLSTDFGGQGYYESTKTLLLPLAANVTQVWNTKFKLDDEGDDYGVERKMSNRLHYRSLSGISFYWASGPEGSLQNDYYDIAVVSHRFSYRIRSRWGKQDYFQDTYQFDGSKYVRTSHERLVRVTAERHTTRKTY